MPVHHQAKLLTHVHETLKLPLAFCIILAALLFFFHSLCTFLHSPRPLWPLKAAWSLMAGFRISSKCHMPTEEGGRQAFSVTNKITLRYYVVTRHGRAGGGAVYLH